MAEGQCEFLVHEEIRSKYHRDFLRSFGRSEAFRIERTRDLAQQLTRRLQKFIRAQRFIPAAFLFACHHAVIRIDSIVLPPRLFDFIA